MRSTLSLGLEQRRSSEQNHRRTKAWWAGVASVGRDA